METCKWCGSSVGADNPMLLDNLMNEVQVGAASWHRGWGYWAELNDGDQVSVHGQGAVDGVWTLVAKSVKYGEEQGEDERPVFLILERGGQFYRKNGVANSYGEVMWNGPFRFAIEKTITTKVYE